MCGSDVEVDMRWRRIFVADRQMDASQASASTYHLESNIYRTNQLNYVDYSKIKETGRIVQTSICLPLSFQIASIALISTAPWRA